MFNPNQRPSKERQTVGEAIIVPEEVCSMLEKALGYSYRASPYGLLFPLDEHAFADKVARTMNGLGRDFKNYPNVSATVKIGTGILGAIGIDGELIPQAEFVAVLVAGAPPAAAPIVGSILASNANQVLDREAYPGPRLPVLPYEGDARIVIAPGATMFLTNDS